MDQEKIGKFIAKRRKEKKLTQRELAELLGVSDRTVGNWECARNMPDLSLFKPLCEILDITLNELICGEKLDKEKINEKLEDNISKTIDYTTSKINKSNNQVGLIFIIFGIIVSITSFTIFPSESSWGSIYSVIGCIISLIGVYKLTKKYKYVKRLIINILYFVFFIFIIFLIDFMSVISLKQPPRFRLSTTYQGNYVVYKSLFYNFYRVNYNTNNEYYIIDLNKKYTSETIPDSPFNRNISGIDNIIKYKNKYVGNNSNDGNLINNLPLHEYGYTFEIDSKNLGLTINYHITNWYINEYLYLEKSLIYNSISMFSLIDNLEYITFNFSGKTFKIDRSSIEQIYPNYFEINKNNQINKDNFNKYLENKLNDDDFVKDIFTKLFNNN